MKPRSSDALQVDVVVVGRGRMGSALIASLRAASVAYTAVSGRTLDRFSGLRRRKPRAVWLLAVTDAAVRATVSTLVSRGWVRAGDVVVHLAGMLGPEVLSDLRAAGAAIGAMHPLVAVSSARRPAPLRGGSASFEGERRALRNVRAVAGAIGLRVHATSALDRTRYHAAAALVATGAVALAQAAEVVFVQAGVSATHASAFASSLLRSAAHNVEASGPRAALASPILRGDSATVARHLWALNRYPEAVGLYAAALSQVVSTLEREGSVDPEVLGAVRRSLNSLADAEDIDSLGPQRRTGSTVKESAERGKRHSRLR